KDKIIFIFYSQNNSYYYYDIDDDKTENFTKEHKMIEYYIQKYMNAFFKKIEEKKIEINLGNKSTIQNFIKSFRSRELKTKTTSNTITRKIIINDIDMYNHKKRSIEEEFETKLINKYKDKEKSISVKTSSGREINLLNTL
ncbi:6485_t:CDS:1, partial [Dentiscutata erythropus]